MAVEGRRYSTEFTVRYDECDVAGLLRPSVYLCYTQEVATRDARDAGWGPHPWVIRRTRLFVHQPVDYTTTLVAHTWGRGLARSSAQRAYEFRVGDVLVAEAHSLWVYLDAQTLRPARLPAEFNTLWFPSGDVQPPSDLPAYPAAPASDPQRSSLHVGYSILDGQQHVNNAAYLDIFDDATYVALAERGLSLASIRALDGGLLPTIYDVEYLLAAEAGDELTVATWLSSTTVNYLDRLQEVRRGDQVVARSQSSWRWVNAQGQERALPEPLVTALKLRPPVHWD